MASVSYWQQQEVRKPADDSGTAARAENMGSQAGTKNGPGDKPLKGLSMTPQQRHGGYHFSFLSIPWTPILGEFVLQADSSWVTTKQSLDPSPTCFGSQGSSGPPPGSCRHFPFIAGKSNYAVVPLWAPWARVWLEIYGGELPGWRKSCYSGLCAVSGLVEASLEVQGERLTVAARTKVSDQV